MRRSYKNQHNGNSVSQFISSFTFASAVTMTRQRGADVEAVRDHLLSDTNDHTPLIRNTDTTLSEQAIDNQGLSTVSFVLVQIGGLLVRSEKYVITDTRCKYSHIRQRVSRGFRHHCNDHCLCHHWLRIPRRQLSILDYNLIHAD